MKQVRTYAAREEHLPGQHMWEVFGQGSRLSLVGTAFGIGLAISASAPPMHWLYEAVDPDKVAGGHAAALDAQDYAHVLYGRDALYYDWEDANGWHSEIADAASAPDSLSMALDAAGRPHTVYADLLTHHVKYARRDAAAWSIETIAEDVYRDPGRGTLAVMCLDPAGWPHVGYSSGDYESLQLKYLGKDTSGWHATTVGSWSQVTLGGLAMSVPGDGQPHVACQVRWPGNAYSVFHAWRRPTGWQSANASGIGGSPQFDSAGRLHLAFENSNGNAAYALINGGASSIEELPGKVDAVRPTLVVTPSGVPHLVFEGFDYPNPNTLQHWTKVGRAWQQSILESNLISDAALTLDASDRPYVLYTARVGGWPNPITYFTKTAWQDAGSWHTEEDPSRPRYDARGSLHLMLTHDNQPRVAYSFSLYGGPGTVFYWHDENGWQERVLAGGRPLAITQIRLALDGAGHPHIAYNGGDDMGFRYAWRDATGWHATSLEDAFAWGDYRQSDLAVDHEGRPHIGYLQGGTQPFLYGGLRYTVLRDARWESSVADSNQVSELALALDGAGRPHFLVYENALALLVHVREQDNAWHRESVTPIATHPDSGPHVFPDIASDRDGDLHICFHDHQMVALRYGHRAAQGWELTTVDASGGRVGIYCSLDLDDQNQPHIAYAVENPEEIRYAHENATGWHISTVDSEPYEYHSFGTANVSLCLAPDGTPHITYWDQRSGSGNEVFRYALLGADGWERIDLERGGSAVSCLVMDSDGLPHIAYGNYVGRMNLSYLYVPPFALTGLTPRPGGQVRLGWQGALEGVGVDGAAAVDGPWSPVAENLSGLEDQVEVDPSLRFFRLRQAPAP